MKYKLLLVEDDEIDVMTVQRALEKTGKAIDLHFAPDGLEALEFLKKEKDTPVLVFLDINMPRMNGIEFLAILRADPCLKKVPVVMLTSSKNDKDVCDAYNYQVAGYLVKPLDMADLVEMIKTVVIYWNYSEVLPSFCTKVV